MVHCDELVLLGNAQNPVSGFSSKKIENTVGGYTIWPNFETKGKPRTKTLIKTALTPPALLVLYSYPSNIIDVELVILKQ